MKKKKKNSKAYLEMRTIAFVLLSLLSLIVLGYAGFGILVTGVISLGTPYVALSLGLGLLTLAVAVYLLLRFSWSNGKSLPREWQSRNASQLAYEAQGSDFAHLSDEGEEAEHRFDEQKEIFKQARGK